MRALVVGYGSIGRRHSRILKEIGCDVAVVSRRLAVGEVCFESVEPALAKWRPGYAVIANRTHEHRGTLASMAAAGFAGAVLVEKPLFDRIAPIPPHHFSHARVAFNLRCHPLLREMKRLVDASQRVLTAHFYVGSYLPAWRPESDYRESYSATRQQGGGVLRDLSHELDAALWMVGPWQRLTASGGHISALEIDSDDAFTVLMETERCPMVSIHMNYLDRVPRRQIVINTGDQTIHADVINNTLDVDGNRESFNVGRDDTYREQHRAMLDGQMELLCTLDEGLETVATIEAAERARSTQAWLVRERGIPPE